MMSDQTISKQGLKEAGERLKKHGQEAALEVFNREPALGQHLADRMERMRQMLLEAGTRPAEMERVLAAMVRMVMEPVLALDKAHRQLMEGLLPDEDLRTKPAARPGEGHGDK
jgi:hypothetical protein